MHASLILPRNDASRLLELLNSTANFPEAAEAIDFALRASILPAVAIITTVRRIDQMTEWLKTHRTDNFPEYDSILAALTKAHDSPFHEEPPISVL
jgi:hypothetical protein